MYQSFEDLDVWKKGTRLAIHVCRSLKGSKEFELKRQIIKSAVSIPSNIAEGAERNSSKEFQRFINISLGSCAELRTQLYIARDIDMLNKKETTYYIAEAKEISAMLFGLRKSLG